MSDDDSSKAKAIAEAIERFCLEVVPQNLRAGSFRSLPTALDPGLFINYTDRALKQPRSRYLDDVRHATLKWAPAKSLSTGEDVLLPAQLVYSSYQADEPTIRAPTSNGAAFGCTRQEAIERGLYEAIERDSFMLWWLSAKPPPAIPSESSILMELKEYFDRYLLDLHLFDIRTDLDVPAVLAVLIDRTELGPAVSVGLRAGRRVVDAAVEAALEAQLGRVYVRMHVSRSETSPVTEGDGVRSIESRGIFWHPPAMRSRLSFLFGGAVGSLPLGDLSTSLMDVVTERGLDVVVSDVTVSDVTEVGACVVKVVVPQLHPLFLDERFPYHESERLRAFHDGELNELPHPFL